MWSKSARLLIVRVKTHEYRRFTFPVSIWVVEELFRALTDLAWVGEIALNRIPLPQDEKARKHLNWVKTISPSGIMTALNMVIKDLSKYKGLVVVDVKAGDVQVKISLK